MQKQQVCTICGYAGSPKKVTKGHFLIEVILWLFFIIPGLIYSIWRLSSKQEVCPKCGNANMIPQDTPQGKKLISENPQSLEMGKEQEAIQKANSKQNLKVIGIVIAVFFGIVILSVVFGKDKSNENTQSVQPAEQLTKPIAQKDLPTEPKARIETIVKNIGDYEITVWDSKGNMAKSTTKPPYEIVINAGNGKIASCSYAKNILTEVMKNLYTDEVAKNKISRVLFTSWGQLRASLGAEDGTAIDWKTAGPTNFWKVMMQFKSYEDETGALSQRTWGKEIANDCN